MAPMPAAASTRGQRTGNSFHGRAAKCRLVSVCRGSARSTPSVGLSPSKCPLARAQSKIVRRRWRTFLAVSGLSSQIGASTALMSATVMALIALWARVG